MKSDSTAAASAPDFPIPYLMQSPYDDLRDALSLLDLFDHYLDDGSQKGISKDAVLDLSVAFSMARANIGMVVKFLHEDDRDGTIAIYQRVRRERIMENFERGRS